MPPPSTQDPPLRKRFPQLDINTALPAALPGFIAELSSLPTAASPTSQRFLECEAVECRVLQTPRRTSENNSDVSDRSTAEVWQLQLRKWRPSLLWRSNPRKSPRKDLTMSSMQ
ncbi:hypothetical protein WJX75_006067 [Coccomyxa subellipsoidea]|uniref:Uncharacterized protein n=1 Tax=Coccomyxa subellipsoidea TaxID=248742 RepID=A0ABR2YQY7_9CHLO